MKHSDFQIGTIFYTCTGQCWQCTDVGTRTILAIEHKPKLDKGWFVGPPYPVAEVPFDEHDLPGCYRDDSEAIENALLTRDSTAHPGFPHEIFQVISRAWLTPDRLAYPNRRLLRIDRVDNTGEILHPYGVHKDGDAWSILVYVLFTEEFRTLPEADFVSLPHATEEDLCKRKDRSSDGVLRHLEGDVRYSDSESLHDTLAKKHSPD